MDDVRLRKQWYRIALERDLLKKKGNAFQDFFSEILEKKYPGDFIRVRPWGNVGDRKNDGYIRSLRILFQVYAPNEMKASEAISKIDEDFHEALPYWKDHFKKWVFVHNSSQGLGPQVTKRLLEIDDANPGITVTTWGFEEVCKLALSLDEDDINTLLGGLIAPSHAQILDVSADDLMIVLTNISRVSPVSELDLRPVPPSKLKECGLSEDNAFLLTNGMRKSDRVRHFFANWPDPDFGNGIAKRFRKEYELLRAIESDPNNIFRELVEFTGGFNDQVSPRWGAILAVLAYLFEDCEIFERPEEAAAR